MDFTCRRGLFSDGEVPHGAGLSGVHGSHGGHPQSRVQGCGHQELLVPVEVAELCLELGVTRDTVQRMIL